jgi:hypothetical protein
MYCLVYCLFNCLHCLFLIAIVRRQRLRESSRARRSRLTWYMGHCLFLLSLSLLFTYWHACFNIVIKALYFRNWVHTWLVMLSHTVLSAVQAFPSLWCWVWLVSQCERCGLPSVEMWFDYVRIGDVVWAMAEMVEMVNTVMTCGARICQGPNVRSRHPRITRATTYPIWSSLLTN